MLQIKVKGGQNVQSTICAKNIYSKVYLKLE